MIHQPPTNTPGHPWDCSHPDRWEYFSFTADTNAELGEHMAMFCLAGWSVWKSGIEDNGLVDTPDGKRFGAVMYRAKKVTETGRATV